MSLLPAEDRAGDLNGDAALGRAPVESLPPADASLSGARIQKPGERRRVLCRDYGAELRNVIAASR